MAEKPYQDFTATTTYEDRDAFRMQRLVSGTWKDYQISLLRLFGDPVPTEALGTAAGYISRVNWTSAADTIGAPTEIFPDPGANKAWVVVDCLLLYANGTDPFIPDVYHRLYRASDGDTVAKCRNIASTGSVLLALAHENAYQFLEQSAIYFETESIVPAPDGTLGLVAYAILVDI